jgi:hypothetical protein
MSATTTSGTPVYGACITAGHHWAVKTLPEGVSSKSKIFKIEAAKYRDQNYAFELKPNGDFVVPAEAPLEHLLGFLLAALKDNPNTDPRIVARLRAALNLSETMDLEENTLEDAQK